MSINSAFTGGSTFTRPNLKLALAFGQSNVQEGENTNFGDLTPHGADASLLFAPSLLSGPRPLVWGGIRGGGSNRFGAMVQFLRTKFTRGEENWAGISYSRGGFSLANHWLPGTDLETDHLRSILDAYGALFGYEAGHSNPIHLDTLYYYQGESDMSAPGTDAANWKANWYQLVARFNAMGLTWDHLVIVKPSSQGYSQNVGYDRIIRSIDELGAERADIVAVLDGSEPGVDGGGDESSTGHLNTVGQVVMGQQWADAIPSLP